MATVLPPGPVSPQRGTVQHEDEQVALAPLATPETLERAPMEQIDPGPVDYVIKCTEGLFQGRFIYVNRTAQGELFGSDKTSKDITMYIENANLSPKHAEIKFDDRNLQYFLRDFGSKDGTWVRIRWNRSIEVAPGQELRLGDTLLEIREGPRIPPEEEVKRWLAAYRLQHLAPALDSAELRSLQDLRSRSFAASDLASSEEDISALAAALGELSAMWPSTGYPQWELEFVHRSPSPGQSEQVAVIGWEGGTLALVPDDRLEDSACQQLRTFGQRILEKGKEDSACQQLRTFGQRILEKGKEASKDLEDEPDAKDANLAIVPVHGWEQSELLRVGCSFGRYYVHFSEGSAESTQRGWVRLPRDQRHWLRPHDLLRVGSLEFQVLRFNSAAYSEQGFRATMEDEDILVQDLAASNWRPCSFFGIYDGHGGRECVSFVRKKLHMNFLQALHARGGLDKSSQVHHDVFDSLSQGFQVTDREFLSQQQQQQQHKGANGGSGCAAVVACVVGGWIWCANVGDSRALLCRDGKAVQLSLDHKPDRQDEAERIQSAGGFVSYRRVLGRLAVSRAFGDEEYKAGLDRNSPDGGKPLVIVDPEIRVEQLTPQDEFLFMACDGLFDVFSSQEAVDFVHSRLASMPANEQDPMKAVQDIVHVAIHERRSRDNVSALLVTFKRAVQPLQPHR